MGFTATLSHVAPSLSAALITSILLYAFVSSITPGPNNLMLLSSGVRFGIRRTLPHMAGVTVGFALMLSLTGLGLVQFIQHWPMLQMVMQIAGTAFLLWMAWHIARANSDPATLEGAGANGHDHPLGFWGAAAFQWINPKAWIMSLGFYSTYIPADSGVSIIVLAAIFYTVVGIPCIAAWAITGQSLRHWLRVGQRLRIFNLVMGLLLALSVIPAWMPH